MPIQLNTPGWRIRASTRGVRGGATPTGFPPEFLTIGSRVAEEAVLDAAPPTRGEPASGGMLDLSVEVEPGQAAIVAIRHPSNGPTFHLPVQSPDPGLKPSS